MVTASFENFVGEMELVDLKAVAGCFYSCRRELRLSCDLLTILNRQFMNK